MSRRKDIGVTVAWLAMPPYAVGLWLVLGDGTCEVQCTSTTDWVILSVGLGLIALSTALVPGGAIAVLGVPVTGGVLLTRGAITWGTPNSPWMLLAGSVIAGLTVAGVTVARRAMRKLSDESGLRDRGLKGRALVLETRMTGWGTEFTRNAVLHLLVEPPDGGATFEVETKHHVHLTSPCRVGDVLPAWIDPRNPRQVLIAVPGDPDYPTHNELEAFGIDVPRFGERP